MYSLALVICELYFQVAVFAVIVYAHRFSCFYIENFSVSVNPIIAKTFNNAEKRLYCHFPAPLKQIVVGGLGRFPRLSRFRLLRELRRQVFRARPFVFRRHVAHFSLFRLVVGFN